MTRTSESKIKITKTEFIDDLDLLISVRGDGAIVYDSRIDWRASGVDKDLFLSIIGDNVVSAGDGEEIDWAGVKRDFQAKENSA